MGKSLVKRGDPMRDVATVSQSNLMLAVSRFGQYVDKTGAKATSEKGLVLSINSAIKRYYGKSRNEMEPDMLLHCSSALVRVIEAMDSGMEEEKTRKAIKETIRSTLKSYGESYHAINSGVTNANAA